MTRHARGAGLTLALLLAGCSAIDPETAQLERFKELGLAQRHEVIAGEDVHCAEYGEVCRQLHLIKGDACFALAQRGDAATAHYECAIAELTAGLDQEPATETALGPDPTFTEKLLEALRGRRDLSASSAESLVYTLRLMQEARAFKAAYPEEPAGYYFEANALYGRVIEGIATGDGDTAICGEIEAALELLEAGKPASGRYVPSFERMARDIQSTRRAECEA